MSLDTTKAPPDHKLRKKQGETAYLVLVLQPAAVDGYCQAFAVISRQSKPTSVKGFFYHFVIDEVLAPTYEEGHAFLVAKMEADFRYSRDRKGKEMWYTTTLGDYSNRVAVLYQSPKKLEK